jgi:type 1 glutamine amidotransferase
MARLIHVVMALAATLGIAAPAFARPVTDCPLRDAPFSANAPLIDLLLSPAARGLVNSEMGGRLDNAPGRFFGTEPPTFSSILTLKEAARFTGMKPEQIAALDARLRALPVTAADRVARCARYDNDVPRFDLPRDRPNILLFEKINGFKDVPSVDGAHAAFVALAARKGWNLVTTDKGGAFNRATLRQFHAVIWNNISGDVLSLSQRRAFENYITNGGAFVGVHGSAGDFIYFWDWYVDTLIGARFIGHPMNPQFQNARVVVEAKDHAIGKALPAEWTMMDEWYSFRTNPRTTGATVIATLDESTYKQEGPMGQKLSMGSDHPIAWTRCVGKGRSFYSAIGHRPETYTEPNNAMLLEAALTWAIIDKNACK